MGKVKKENLKENFRMRKEKVQKMEKVAEEEIVWLEGVFKHLNAIFSSVTIATRKVRPKAISKSGILAHSSSRYGLVPSLSRCNRNRTENRI